MSIDSSLMWNNMVAYSNSGPSKYVKETLAIHEMSAATKIDQNKIVAGLTKKAADARTLAAIRNAKSEVGTYDNTGKLAPTAPEMATALVQADADAAAQAKDGPNIAGIGILDTTV